MNVGFSLKEAIEYKLGHQFYLTKIACLAVDRDKNCIDIINIINMNSGNF